MDMADSIKLKDKTATTPAPAPVAPAVPVAVVPTVVGPPRLPELEDSAVYRTAYANVVRLKLEIARLEGARDNFETLRAEALAERKNEVAKVLAGASASQVRRESTALDADIFRVTQDLRLTRQALAVAERELPHAEATAKHEACAPLAPHFRRVLRTAAVAHLSSVKAVAELDKINDHLGERGMRGYGGLDSPSGLRVRGGDPFTDDQSETAGMIRELLDIGILDVKADAELLSGLAVRPPAVVFVGPPPKPPKSKEPSSFAKALRSLGVGFGNEW
jgi:hypothetical protein